HSGASEDAGDKDKRSGAGWYWMPVGVGLGYICFQRLTHIKSDISKEQHQQTVPGVAVPGPWQLHV
ncbi:hypothetical protein H4S02_010238, partial [Coemansia sp. RSA 2611]